MENNKEINYLLCIGYDLKEKNINDYIWHPIFKNNSNKIIKMTSETLEIFTNKKWSYNDINNLIKIFNNKTRKIDKWVFIKELYDEKEKKKVNIFMRMHIFD